MTIFRGNNLRHPPTHRPKPLKTAQDGWRVLYKDDGVDYPALLADFKAGRLSSRKISGGEKGSEIATIFTVDVMERRFVFKHYVFIDKLPLEKRLWHLLAGSKYARCLRKSILAVHKGCRAFQEFFLISEKYSNIICREVWLITDYIEGTDLVGQDLKLWRRPILDCVAQVHAHGLASGDLHAGNLVLTPRNEIKLLDVSFSSSIPVSQMKDLALLRGMVGMAHPFKKILLPTWRRRFLFNFVLARDFLRSTLRRWQGKL